MNQIVRSAVLRKGSALALVAITLALAGCARSTSSNIPYATEAFNVQPDPLFPDPQQHRLGPTDLIQVAVYRAPEVSGEFRIDGLGNITMPLIGAQHLQGMTPAEAATEIKQNLEGSFYVNPDVGVVVKEAVSQRFTVDGAVNSPGLYPVGPRTTLLQALAMADGASGGAKLGRIAIFRQIDGQRMAAAFDLRAIRAGEMEDPLVYASDVIVVDGNQTRQALRDVLLTLPILGLFRPLVY